MKKYTNRNNPLNKIMAVIDAKTSFGMVVLQWMSRINVDQEDLNNVCVYLYLLRFYPLKKEHINLKNV